MDAARPMPLIAGQELEYLLKYRTTYPADVFSICSGVYMYVALVVSHTGLVGLPVAVV